MSHDDLHIMSSKIISSAKAFLAYMCMTLDGDTQKTSDRKYNTQH